MDKSYCLGLTEVVFIENDINVNEEYNNLQNFYKSVQTLARTLKEEGKNIDNWFYSEEEILNIKNNSNWIKLGGV